MSQLPLPGLGPGLSAKLSGLLGNPLLEQIFVWQVLQQITGAVLAPELAGLQEEIFKLDPSLQVSVADAVDAVVKAHMTQQQGEDEAKLSGISPERFRLLVDNAGEPIPLQMALEAWRRGLIPKSSSDANAVSLEKAIRDSRLKNVWIPTIEDLQFLVPTVGDAVDAWVKNQVSPETAKKWLYDNGIAADVAQTLFNTRGNPPGPADLIELARRKIIPVKGTGPNATTLEQGIYEGVTKDKWEFAYEALMRYVPPPRTVTALLRAGSITEARALQLFEDAGLTEQDAAAYVADAQHQRTAATRELVKSDVLALYEEQVFDEPTATTHLRTLGYSEADAAFELAAADFRSYRTLVTHAVNRVRTLYTGHKIGEQLVIDTLDKLNVKPAQRDRLLEVWAIERADNVKTLTPAQILDLLADGVEPEETVIALLTQEGYSELDAWYLVAIKLKGGQKTPKPAA